MANQNIKVLALDLDGTLTNDQKEITPRTRAALDAALARGVTLVLASGRPTAGVLPVAPGGGRGPGRRGGPGFRLGLRSSVQDVRNIGCRTRNDVYGDEFSDALGGCRPRIGRGLDRAYIAFHHHGYQSAADMRLADERHTRCFDHRVGRLD